MPNRTFLILGPDDGDGIPQHWDREFFGWSEGEAGNKPSPSCVFMGVEIDFPIRELPGGVVAVVCLETGQTLTPEGSENKI